MARIRTIKPEMWESQRLGRLSVTARLTFVGLISLADDEGRGRGGLRFLMGRLHPYAPDVTEGALRAALAELAGERPRPFAVFYEADGGEFYALPGWAHQYIEKPKGSELPPPPATESDDSPPLPLQRGDQSPQDRKGREGKGTEELLAPSSAAGAAASPPAAFQESSDGEKWTDIVGPAKAPPVLVFPCAGRTKEWALTEAKLKEYQEAFPGVPALEECRKALQWLRDNPKRLKTAGGLPRFLGSWLGRAQDSIGSLPGKSAAALPPAAPAPRPRCLRCHVEYVAPGAVVCAGPGCAWCLACDEAGRPSPRPPAELVQDPRTREVVCRACAAVPAKT